MILLAVAITLAMSGCATQKKTYEAPDAAHMHESELKLRESVAEASASAKHSHELVQDARASITKVSAFTASLKTRLELLRKHVHAELRPEVVAAQVELTQQETEEAFLTGRLADAEKMDAILQTQLKQAEADRDQLQKDQGAYVEDAGKLANAATGERDKRIADETKLHWYRMHWWLSWIVLVSGAIVCALVAFLKFTGRLAVVAAKVGL